LCTDPEFIGQLSETVWVIKVDTIAKTPLKVFSRHKQLGRKSVRLDL